jgi:hypothetical protein
MKIANQTIRKLQRVLYENKRLPCTRLEIVETLLPILSDFRMQKAIRKLQGSMALQ